MRLSGSLDLVEEGAFLFACRGKVTRSSAVTLDVQLTQFDNRLSMVLDRLSANPRFIEYVSRHEVMVFKDGLAFVTAVVALRSGEVEPFDELVMRLDSDSSLLYPVVSAWLLELRVRFASRSRTCLATLRLRAWSWHFVLGTGPRLNPSAILRHAFEAAEPGLRARALEVVGRLALSKLRPRLPLAWNAVVHGADFGRPGARVGL